MNRLLKYLVGTASKVRKAVPAEDYVPQWILQRGFRRRVASACGSLSTSAKGREVTEADRSLRPASRLQPTSVVLQVQRLQHPLTESTSLNFEKSCLFNLHPVHEQYNFVEDFSFALESPEACICALSRVNIFFSLHIETQRSNKSWLVLPRTIAFSWTVCLEYNPGTSPFQSAV